MAPAVLVLILLARLSRAEDPPPTTLPARPIRDSIERIVDKIDAERKEPCRKAIDAGVPCFPTTTETHGPVVSVRDSLRNLGIRGGGGANGLPGMPPKVNGVGFDPVCVAKSLVKAAKGKNDVYYLYRVRDIQGERVILQDRRLDAANYQGALELLGEFHGECEALAAFRHEERRAPGLAPTSR